MKRCALAAGIVTFALAWALAAAGHGLTGHMAAHMAAVAVAAPFLAIGLAGTSFDAATRWPRTVTPIRMMLLELAVVWGWHAPALRAWAAQGGIGLALEQAMFSVAGLLLWSACLGTRDAFAGERRVAGVAALLLTTMHMTLLGVLVTLAPRVLFADAGIVSSVATLTPLADQQLGGVVMLLIGAGSYLVGALALLSGVLKTSAPRVERS
jgi:putative membrane protein